MGDSSFIMCMQGFGLFGGGSNLASCIQGLTAKSGNGPFSCAVCVCLAIFQLLASCLSEGAICHVDTPTRCMLESRECCEEVSGATSSHGLLYKGEVQTWHVRGEPYLPVFNTAKCSRVARNTSIVCIERLMAKCEAKTAGAGRVHCV
jgi:hypothetical protein